MTIVAGYLPPDGALLGADCRVTMQGRGGPICTDVAQKIIKLGPASAIGYSGDILAVASLLANLWRELPRRRSDPLSLRLWLPRFFRYICRRLRALNYPQPSVSFLVASSLIGKPTCRFEGACVAISHGRSTSRLQ